MKIAAENIFMVKISPAWYAYKNPRLYVWLHKFEFKNEQKVFASS